MQESGLLEIITLISTLIRTSNCCFCLKSVLWATLLAAAVTKDLIVGNYFIKGCPRFHIYGWLQWLITWWLQHPLFTDMAGKFIGLQCALFSTTWEKVAISTKILMLSQKVTMCFYLNRTYRVWTVTSVQSLSRVWLCGPMNHSTAGLPVHHQLPEFTQTHVLKSVMPSSHLILCHTLLLLPLIPPIIRVFSNESTLRMRWPKYYSFSFSIIPSKEIPELISFRMDWGYIHTQIHACIV